MGQEKFRATNINDLSRWWSLAFEMGSVYSPIFARRMYAQWFQDY